MIAAARRSSTNEADRITYLVADCTKPQIYPGGPFDIVLGAWLLNYASSADEMTETYTTIAMNLSPNGHFIGLTPHPSNDMHAYYGELCFSSAMTPQSICLETRKIDPRDSPTLMLGLMGQNLNLLRKSYRQEILQPQSSPPDQTHSWVMSLYDLPRTLQEAWQYTWKQEHSQ